MQCTWRHRLHSHVWCHYSSESSVKISVLDIGGEGEHREGGMEGETEGGMVVTCGSCRLRWGFEGQGAWLGLALLVLCHHKHIILSVPFQTGQHYVLAHVGKTDLRLPVGVFPLCTKKQPWNDHKDAKKKKKRRKILYLFILNTHSFVSDQIMGDWRPSIVLFDPFYFESIAFGVQSSLEYRRTGFSYNNKPVTMTWEKRAIT